MKKPLVLLQLLVLALVLIGCAALPGPSTERSEKPPWIEELPDPTRELRFFYGLGADSNGDREAAQSIAAEQIAVEIIATISGGGELSDETAERHLLGLRDRIVEAISGDRPMDGIYVEDRYVAAESDGSSSGPVALQVHLLVSASRSFLEAQRRGFQGAAASSPDAIPTVIIAEAEAEDLESRGRYLQAAEKYIQAAAEALTSNTENRELRFDRNISAAENILSEVRLEKLNDVLTTEVTTAFAQPFRASLTIGGRGIPEAELLVEYAVIEPNGRTGSETTSVTTNSEGIASFDHPVPRFVGTETLSMTLRPDPFLAPLSSLSEATEGAVDRITSILSAKRVLFRYTVESAAAVIPTAVTLLATDIAGNPMESGALETGFRQRLEAEAFDLRPIEFPRRRLTELSPQALASALRTAAPADLQRVVYGVARIEEFNERDGIIVSVSGSASVVRLADGEIITTVEGVQHSRGSSSQSAIAAAFRGLGDKLALELLRSLSSR